MAASGRKYKLRKVTSKMEDIQNTVVSEIKNLRKEVQEAKATSSANTSVTSDSSYDAVLVKLDLLQAKFTLAIDGLKGELDELLKSQSKIGDMVNGYHIKQCNKTLIIRGVPEHPNEELLSVVVDFFRSKLTCDVTKSEINTVYRMGKKQDNKVRLIAVEFVCQWKKEEMFKNKRRLKGTNIMITEMLPISMLDLFRECRKKFGSKCWTHNGKIIVLQDGSTCTIKGRHDFENILPSAFRRSEQEQSSRSD